MHNRGGRRILPEILEGSSDADVAASLADLCRINRYFGGHAILKSAIGRWYGRQESFRVLDIGAASGDMGLAVRRHFPRASVTSLDHCVRHLRSAPAPKLAGDVFHLPFAERSFDVVCANLFLHHFTDEQIVEMLRSMILLARRGVIVIDLERQWFARAFLPATRSVFRWHPVTIHDAALSVDAAFKPGELRHLANCAGLANAAIRRHIPWFRLSLCAETG